MRSFNYSIIKELKWDSELLGLIAAIYKEAGKQEMYLKQRPEKLEKLVEIAAATEDLDYREKINNIADKALVYTKGELNVENES